MCPKFFFQGIQSCGSGGDILQQTQAISSQLEMAVVSGGTQQQQRSHEVQQPQPQQEESPGVSVKGGGRRGEKGYLLTCMNTDSSKSIQCFLNSDLSQVRTGVV